MVGCYVIINWCDGAFMDIVGNVDGDPCLFNKNTSAEKYGKENLNWNWKVVEL